MTDIYQVLHTIQKTLKAPKNQKNTFGGYNYRSCEDIVEAVKAILPEGATLKLSDDIVMLGNRFYVKATASLCYGGQCESVSGFAREAETRKGFGEDQLTGAASSYARKYALNGLFMIDDTKDADTMAPPEKQEKPKAEPKPEPKPEMTPTQAWLKTAAAEIAALKTPEAIQKWQADNVKHFAALSAEQEAWLNGILAKARVRTAQAEL